MRARTSPRSDSKVPPVTAAWALEGQCKCGYRHESVHQCGLADLTFHPFFCAKCSAVKAQLGLRKSTPVCPTCQTSNVLSYGEEALTNPAMPGTQPAAGVEALIAHFCPQCRNASLFFSVSD